mmetsp:Transcript_18424/g.38355  ORF Transcript_18424/g.38355 Transcript_18424/m.38355 type:complete len:427 (+) Transcript_18424:46-1326(+)
MSKPFDYSKWDNIELSDDEDDCHPNIEKESWFRMKHRSRVEREEKEEIDKRKIKQAMARDNLRIDELNRSIKNIEAGGEDGSDDELEDVDGMKAEIKELEEGNRKHQAKLDDYEKNKKWNVDNLCSVVDEKTYVNKDAVQPSFDASGYALPNKKDEEDVPKVEEVERPKVVATNTNTTTVNADTPPAPSPTKSSGPAPPPAAPSTSGPAPPPSGKETMLNYADFTTKHEKLLETYCNLTGMTALKDFLLSNGSILLQEHAASYLLLSCLEDEMNGEREKMKNTARNSQILTNIAELAKSLKRHPGNVIVPFFTRVDEPEHNKAFMEGVTIFVDRIIKRAVEKRKEMEAEQEVEEVDLSSIPKEERLGPGGLDPIEVFESLPKGLQAAFESREMDKLQEALMAMTPKDAQYHMKRCADSGLWNPEGN